MQHDLFRSFDPARGAFDPVERHPARSDANPKAVRRVDKTRQDRLPVAERARVREALARRA